MSRYVGCCIRGTLMITMRLIQTIKNNAMSITRVTIVLCIRIVRYTQSLELLCDHWVLFLLLTLATFTVLRFLFCMVITLRGIEETFTDGRTDWIEFITDTMIFVTALSTYLGHFFRFSLSVFCRTLSSYEYFSIRCCRSQYSANEISPGISLP